MRKIYALFLVIFALSVLNTAKSQTVSTYIFSQSTGVYSPINGGILLGTTSSDDQYFVNPAIPAGGTTNSGQGFPIGFTFTYAGNTYDRVGVNNNGWIALGNSTLTTPVNLNTTSAYTPLSSAVVITPNELRARIAGVGRDLQAQAGAELRLETIGTAPNRQLVVQWTNYKRFGTSGTGDAFNFQIILNETTNVVQVKYGAFVFGTTSTTSVTAQIGLGGRVATDYHNRKTDAPHDWNTTVAGTTNAEGAQFQTTTIPVTPPADGLTFSWAPPSGCSGTPTGGTTESTATSACSPTFPFTLSVTGATIATGLTYQWQSSPNNTTWTDIPGATLSSLNVTGISATTYFRRRIICGANSSFSTPISVSVTAPAYTTLPFTESFEANWVDGCDAKDIPNNFWRNTPATGNNSWRRSDDAATTNSGAWGNNNGAYTPEASAGSFSARFHTWGASSGTKGQLDLYVNCNTGSSGKRLNFDFINTSGSDSLVVLLSTNGGVSFTRLDSVRTSTVWKTKSILFASSSATTVIRFEATSDFGTTDIGLDNVSIVNIPDCSGTPVGGTVAPATMSVCTGNPFTLSVTGATDATTVFGITYQWQSSPDGTTWTNIAGATDATYTSAGISATTQFRRLTICSGNNGTSTAATITVSQPAYATLPFAESFEANWLSICAVNDAPNNFWRGVPVDGNNSWRRHDDGASANWGAVATGMYTPAASHGVSSARFHTWSAPSGTKGQLNLHLNAATASATKRLSFDFINPVGNDSLVIYLSTNGGSTFVRLDSVRTAAAWKTKQIIFTSTSATTILRFEATSDFGTGASDIGLDNINVVDFPACSGTPTGGTAVSSSTTVCPNTPFTLNATGATDASGITFQWQSSPDGTTWTNIAGATGTTHTINGITAITYYRRQILCGTANSFSTAVQVGINLPVYATMPFAESFENTWINGCGVKEIPNNFWRNSPLSGNNSWRRNDEGDAAGWTNIDNGEYNPDASNGSYSARFHTWSASSGTKGQLNLHLNAATASAAKRLSFDFINTSGNDSLVVYLSTNGGSTFVRLDSVRTSSVWKTKSIEFSSTSATTIIRFEATSDFGVTDIGLDNILVTDFSPCAGAPNAGTAVSSSGTVCAEQFTLSLQGSTSAAGITYQWQSSTNGTTYNDIAGATGFTYTTSQTGTTWYRVEVSCGSESSLSVPVQVISPALVSGNFVINNALPTDVPSRRFNNFNEAYNYIKCGISGPVVFDVVNNVGQPAGSYNEQLIMTPIPGASIVNTVTFAGHGSTIGFTANNTNERAVIKLRGADYIRFDSLIINAGSGTYGYGVQLISNADSNIISNCIINTNTTATTANFAGIVINGSETGVTSTGTVLCDFNQFIGNTINGGYAGMTLAASLTGANLNNRYINNTVKDFYLYGIYVAGSSGTVIEGNSFSRPTRSILSTFNGIYFTTVSTRAMVSKNRIHNPFGGDLASTEAFNGIFFTGVDATTDNENMVVNNLIYKVNGQGAQVGISNTGSDNVWYLHNTIALDSVGATSTATTRGFYQTTEAGGILFYNNMVTISRGGTGTKHAVYLNSAATGFIADHNNYFLNSAGGTNSVGYLTTTRATINDWRAATNQEANSLSRNPFYANAAAGDYTPTNGAVDNKATNAGIVTDIVNVNRQDPPDIGAFEFVALPCTLPPDAGNTVFNDTTVCQNSPVRIYLTVSSWGATQTFQWQTSQDGATNWTNFGSLMEDPDTTIIANTTVYFRAAVTCGGTTSY
ncbi:MAG TPA: hypothetical protein VMR70_19100, partial [Flavisolibacter sp.]|nr:hypothetical protein [Flavisolibacter sp.]